MKLENYRELSKEKLEGRLKELDLELIKSSGMMGMAKLGKSRGKQTRGGSNLTKRIRREIARVKTILREKELESKR